MKKLMKFTTILSMTIMFILVIDSCKKSAELASVTTSPVSDITGTSAKCGGNITSDGGATITNCGVCWSTGTTPTISDNKTTDGIVSSGFTSSINGLSQTTTYYVRAYATNSAGTAYGNVVSFTTTHGSGTDVTKPVIIITNNDEAHNRVMQFSSTNYNDPGATATDDVDGAIPVTVSGLVNMNSAGDYIVSYTATDNAGNFTTADRTVTVDGGLFLAGSYTAEDFTGSNSNGVYAETITSSIITNKIIFTKFGMYSNAVACATISGTTITVPQQTIMCGMPADNHTFTGTGTFSSTLPHTFTIYYTDVCSQGSFTGHDNYVSN